MYNDLLFTFEDTSVLDAVHGLRSVCFAVTRVLVGDAHANCSATVDLDSYLPVPVPGDPHSLDFISLRVATPAPTHDPAIWLDATRTAFDAALRSAGFFSPLSPATARVVSLEYRRTYHAEFYVLLFFIAFLTLGLMWRERPRPGTGVARYTNLPNVVL